MEKKEIQDGVAYIKQGAISVTSLRRHARVEMDRGVGASFAYLFIANRIYYFIRLWLN